MTTKRENQVRQNTTIGWKFLVDQKYGSQQWVSSKLLKESNPVEVAEFVTDLNIADDPAFAWLVPFFLINIDRVISAVNSRV